MLEGGRPLLGRVLGLEREEHSGRGNDGRLEAEHVELGHALFAKVVRDELCAGVALSGFDVAVKRKAGRGRAGGGREREEKSGGEHKYFLWQVFLGGVGVL